MAAQRGAWQSLTKLQTLGRAEKFRFCEKDVQEPGRECTTPCGTLRIPHLRAKGKGVRRVFENSVNAAHSTSIARPCDGGVSELFRSCFFALAMFSRRWRENIASVPAGLFSPFGLKTHGLQVRFAHPPNCAPCGQSPPGVPHGLFSPCGLKTHDLQVRFAPLRLRPVRAWPARGSAWLIFALWAQNAHAPGPLKRTLRTAPRAGAARPGFRPASRFAPGGRGFLSGADVENRPKRGILKLM